MDFDLREEQQAVVELARQILQDHATNERLKELEASQAAYDSALWQALAQSSLLGTAIAEDYGGAGLGFPVALPAPARSRTNGGAGSRLPVAGAGCVAAAALR